MFSAAYKDFKRLLYRTSTNFEFKDLFFTQAAGLAISIAKNETNR